MIEKDAKQYDDFCKFIEGRSAFSPWLDDYDPSIEDGFAFVYAGAEDNGRFGIGDLDLYFNTKDFSYKDVLEKVKNYLSECEETLSHKDADEPENLETEYVENLRELVQAIESWVEKSNESKKHTCSMQKKIESLRKKNEADNSYTKADCIRAIENMRNGWRDLVEAWSDFGPNGQRDMLDDVSDGLSGLYSKVFVGSLDELSMDEWADAMVKRINDYK